MGFLSDGIDGDDESGFVRYGVGEVRRQVQSAKLSIDSLRPKMAKASGKVKQQWETFLAQWDNFYKSTQGVEGAFTQFKDATYERTLKFQGVAEGLANAADSAKVTPAKTAIAKKANDGGKGTSISLPNLSIGWDVPWLKLLKWGVISAGGIYVGHKVYRHYSQPARKVVAFTTGPTEPQQTE